MSARWLFRARSLLPDLGRRLGSWRLSVVLMVLAVLYYGFLAIWATSSPPHVVERIATMLPFWLLYLLLLVNTGACLWRRLPRLAGELAAVRSAGGLRRWAPLGTYLFHGAFFLIAIGFLLTHLARREDRVWVAAGEEYRARPEQFLSQSPPRVLSARPPDLRFAVEGIRPEFWRDELLFTTLEAELELGTGRRATTRINRPLWIGWGTFLRMSGFGYAPRYELADRDGHILDSAFVKLNVFPPGKRDYFVLPGYPHRLYLEVFPDFAVREGEAVSRSFSLGSPAVAVQVYRGRLEMGRGLLRPGDGYRFEGLTLRFPEIGYWGEFTIVSDPGAPIVMLGLLLGLIGLAVKLPSASGDAPRSAPE